MKIAILTQNFPPEPGSASMRMAELSAYLVEQGHRVTVLTGFPNYPDGVLYAGYRGKVYERKTIDGATVIRTFLLTTTQRRSFGPRLANYLSFMVTSVFGGLAAGRPDLVYFYSPPLFLGVSAWLLGRLYSVPTVMELNDLWPQAPIALGVMRNPRSIRLAYAVERFVYQHTSWIFLYSNLMRQALAARGVPESKTEIHPLWVETAAFRPQPPEVAAALRSQYGLEGQFVVLYAGNIGLAQGLGTVIEAAQLLAGRPDIVFVLVGEGAEKAGLMQRAAAAGLHNVRFIGQQPVTAMPAFFSAADALLVNLDPAPHRLGTIPAKALAYMSCARPVLMAAEGASADLIATTGSGVVAEPGNPQAMADAVLKLYADPAARQAMGERGRAAAVAQFERAVLLRQLEARLIEIARRGGRGLKPVPAR